MTSLQQLAAAASQHLQQQNRLAPATAHIEARMLLQHALGAASHAWLLAHGDEPATAALQHDFAALLARRLAGEPIAYILGWREFFGRRFQVTTATLIPRPETETLIEAALEKIPPQAACRILDLGCGSGAIGITLALERPASQVTVTDISVEALAVARENANQLGAHNVTARCGHWLQAVTGLQFDLIVSNPPYVADDDPHLQQGDLRFEPAGALSSGADGLADIRIISAQAAEHLVPGGWLVFEHGYRQGAAVRGLMQRQQFTDVHTVTDLAGQERVTLGQFD